MFGLNLPKKIVSSAQMWISLALVLAAFIVSLSPLLSISTSASVKEGETLKESIASTVTEITGTQLASEEIGDNISISPIKLISSADLFVRILSATAGGSVSEANKLRERMQTESGKQDIITISAISVIFSEISSGSGGSDNVFSVIFNVLITLVSFIAILLFTLAIPVILLVKLIISLIRALANVSTPERASGKLGSSLSSMVGILLLYMLIQCAIPGLQPSASAITVCILALASAAINAIVTRLRTYTPSESRYLCAVQGSAVVSVAGFAVYFFSLISSGIFRGFIGGNFSEYVAKILSITVNDPSAKVNNSYIISGILMLAYVVLAIISVQYLDKAARRLSLGGARREHNIILAIIALATCIIPLIVSGAQHFYINPESVAQVGDASFLPAESFNISALGGAIAGACVMLVSEIASIVLSSLLAKDLSGESKRHLLSGASMAEYMQEQ